MAFGQQSGPPASGRQVQELLNLLKEAGHSDFRDARGPMGFTQRQAGGRFSRDEASEFIDQLQDAEFARASPVSVPRPGPRVAPRPGPRAVEPGPRAVETGLDHLSAEQLAVELRRRGWTVIEP
ncbi:MAG: hypothetical protein ABSC41_04580 [Acidimicrobiales bacterium]